MKYMLMMNTSRDGYSQYMRWPKQILEANIAFMSAFAKNLKAAGELVGADHKLQSRTAAHRIACAARE